ncbi:MAG: hypothetical protein GKC04_05610 [Methanomicrobiales archaeon]|nr:hypothetical protein [Methanomicrobiales archaeon]
MSSDSDTYSYQGWLISDHFWKRALAVLAYSIIGQLMLAVIVGVVVVIFTVITVFVFGMAGPV